MDVSHQHQEVGFLLADDRFVAILKEVAVPPVPAVEGDGIAGHEAAHDLSQVDVSAPEQKVKVVGKQRPSVTADLRLLQDRSKTGQEVLVVPRVPENPGPLNSPGHDVLKKSGGVESRLSRHEKRLIWLSGYLVDQKAQAVTPVWNVITRSTRQPD